MPKTSNRILLLCTLAFLLSVTEIVSAVPYLDNETLYSNQNPNVETRRSDHFRVSFGHYNWDSAGMSEDMAQGNLQMFEQMWNRWVNELGMHDINESVTKPDGNKYKTNFNFLMTYNDGGGGGAWSSVDANGFGYAMANPGYCRYDPPSGATPHEMGHAWEATAGGFNGSDSSGAWWECTANWMQLQFLNSYPQAGGVIWNSMYYPCHGRSSYDSWIIYEAARENPAFGPAWVNRLWTDYTSDQALHEYILDRMLRIDNGTGATDRPGAVKDLWGDMAKKCVTWDFERQRWLAQANSAEDGSDWYWYQRCRTPLVKMAGNAGWYRPERSHVPQQYGFNIIPLSASAGSVVTCNFAPKSDPVRQSDWRACLVAVSNNGDTRYSCLWNIGTNSITLSSDETKLYLVVIAVPKPVKPTDPAWQMYLSDAGVQFPYAVSFTNASPKNVFSTLPTGVTWKTFTNADGTTCTNVQSTATVDSTAYVSPNAQVLGTAKVQGYARIEDYAVVRGSAVVKDYAVVSGHAMVQDNAQVYGNAKVRDWARVFGYAEIYENARVIEHANCGDGNATTHTKVFGNAVVKGTTYLYDTSTLQGCIIMEGDSANGNGAVGSSAYIQVDRGVHFGWQWGNNTTIFGLLADNGYIYAQHDFERDNPVFATDKYGINHGFLMNGTRAGAYAGRGGLVLPLNGINQYVELHNSVNDFRETAITTWVKWTGSATDQRIWSMGDGAGKVMYLTPVDGNTGKLRFVITDGTTTQYLTSNAAMPANTWTHIAITFGSPIFNTSTKTWSATGTLYVNGSQVATSSGMLTPDSLNAANMENANYIGRGNAGNFFQGFIDDFRVYMKTLAASEVAAVYNTAAPSTVTIAADTTAPTPNAATWLSAPSAITDSAITMSATPGTDASGWVEYYFACTSGGGHDSGWVSFNKYTDVGLLPGTSYTYTVKMRDKAGNVTAISEPTSATTQVSSTPSASFAYGPVGASNSAITMTATKVSSPSGLVEYKFDRVTSPISGTVVVTSNWQSSPTWKDATGLTSGITYYYRVTVRDGRGNTSAASPVNSATARDMSAPQLPIATAEWNMQPYVTIDNKVSMTAKPVLESGVQVYYQCVSGGGPDSGWLPATSTDDSGKSYYVKWTSAALEDGTYTYRYKLRDAAGNESPYSTTQYSAIIKPTTGYHSYALSQLASLPDDYLVNFSGTVVQVNTNSYLIKDLSSGASIVVKPNAGKSDSSNNEATDAANLFKNVTVKGHLYTLAGARVVTYSTVTATGNATTYTISGKVTNSSGVAISGATVYFGNSAGAAQSPSATAVTDINGNYTRAVINGTWYVAAVANDYYLSNEQNVVVSSANVSNINFTLATMPKISGKVTNLTGTPVAGASVYFSKTASAAKNPIYTATTDSEGNYSRGVDAGGPWYVAASAAGYAVCADTVVASVSTDVGGVNLALTPGGDGLLGQYYGNKDLTNLMVTRIDPQLNFNFGGVGPDSSMGSSNYSVRWSGQIRPKYSQTYTFFTTSDDGVRLWVNNKLLVDNWTNHGTTENSGSITLTAGKWYPIIMEYFQADGGAVAKLEWSSPSQAREFVPQSCFWSVSQPVYSISGKVTDLSGAAISGATVSFSDTLTGAAVTLATTDTSGNYSQAITDGTWYVSAAMTGYLNTKVQPVVVSGAALTNVNFAMGTSASVPRNVPQTDQIIFGCVTESLPGSGPIAIWPCLYPAGSSISPIYGSPQAVTINNVKWEQNTYPGCGFRQKQYYTPIPVNGASIVTVVKPVRTGQPDSFTSIVNCFGSRFSLGVRNDTGLVCIHRNGTLINNTTPIPDGQITILSLIMQPNGAYKVYANGVQVMSGAASGTFTSLTPGSMEWEQYIDVGLTKGGYWSTFNGYIGDTFLYKVALTDAERLALETDMSNKLTGIVKTHTITASAGAGGSITPSGYVTLSEGSSQTFTITPNAGATIDNVLVDGVSVGAVPSYTFNNIIADHTISVTYRVVPFTITASAGTGGSISPSGTVSVDSGKSQTFVITPAEGYTISSVLVDGVSVGAVSSYTFSNVTANHTISASFGSSLAVHYKFDEVSGTSAADSSGNSRNGTVSSMTNSGWSAGILNNALRFSGTYAYYVNVPTSTLTSTYTGCTIAMWLNPGSTNTKYLYYGGGSSSGTIRIQIAGTATARTFTVAITGNSTSSNTTSAIALPSNAWTHVAFAYSATDKKCYFYVNGVLTQSLNYTTAVNPLLHSGTTYLGNQGTTASNAFVGYIDDFRLYSAALNASSIAALYDSTGPHTITASASANGSITPSGSVSVNYGANQAFTITPNAGYAITGLNVDGLSLTPTLNYTFSNVTANHTISTDFAKLIGVNNRTALTDEKLVGKAVKIWGKVKSVNGTTSFIISDGYNSTGVSVNVNGATLPTGFDIGKMAVVTGILGADKLLQAQIINTYP